MRVCVWVRLSICVLEPIIRMVAMLAVDEINIKHMIAFQHGHFIKNIV